MSPVKNCVEVWSRLFDHKPFLQTELNSFVREFEEKREDREIVNLLDVLKTQCEISNQLDAISNFDNSVLHSLDEKIHGCVKLADEVLKCDKVEKERSTLEIRRKQRASSWKSFEEGMGPKREQFDDELKKELEQIKKFYENQSQASRSN